MRRSTIWFLIAALWLVNAGIAFGSRVPKRAILPAGIALAFAATGVLQRRREEAAMRRPRIPEQVK
ncbi:hypothetical protein [Silvibacterium dinghuense]|uniref:Uncharacterized protein n=1 Tax=Silvibacterium dinghuense TaxID=1560006 RepID=A0A4Q1SKC7_9BACT|nr:hypothetical protein [Silvibacterium dinghuense]RXS97915.1 hypothetical protein ESZ00_08680 [Silvibacterium dinghuense]GGH02961.1 hypothetical protein GCM10011586_18560 [Silvibacterium dinghuense]